jgi:hypothetical protein
MSRRAAQCDGNFLSAFALMIGGAFPVGLPLAVVIVWICS